VVQISTSRYTQGRDDPRQHTCASLDHAKACERSTGAQENKNVTKIGMLKKAVGFATNAAGQNRHRKFPVIPMLTYPCALGPTSPTVASCTVVQRGEMGEWQFFNGRGCTVFSFYVTRTAAASCSRYTPHRAPTAGASQTDVNQTQDRVRADSCFANAISPGT
jgi:hypothetical protein